MDRVVMSISTDESINLSNLTDKELEDLAYAEESFVAQKVKSYRHFHLNEMNCYLEVME